MLLSARLVRVHRYALGHAELRREGRWLAATLACAEAPRTRSELETRFREFCDAHGLPQPRCNTIIDGHEVDFRWPGTNLVVETDGWAYHRTPGRRERDATKRLALEAAGYR